MSDYAHRKVDQEIRAIERRLKKEYRQAEKEIQEKLDDYFRRYEIKDEIWRRWVKEGKKSKQEYKEWRTGQLAVGKRWQKMRETLAKDLANTNQIARSVVSDHMADAYALNHDWGTYEVEKGALIDTSYTLYSRDTVERLMRDNPKLLPDPGKGLMRNIYNGLDVRYNRQILQSVLMQGIIQGESIPKIAKRLAQKTGETNYKSAVRNARTMMTSAQNAGRIDAYKRAENMGINLKKTWIATLDHRTRYAHRQLHGQTVPVDEAFDSELGKIRYPGDPEAKPANVYNCRCTLRGQIEGYEVDVLELARNRDIEGMSFEEWRKQKKAQTNPILLPEEKAEAIKMSYIARYRKK